MEFNRTEKTLSGILLIAGVLAATIGFASFGEKKPPRKVWIANQGGGEIILDHAFHSSLDDCHDCHHNYDPNSGKSVEMKCRNCHYWDEKLKLVGVEPHRRAIGTQCFRCHAKRNPAMVKCAYCHIPEGWGFLSTSREAVVFPAEISIKTDSGTVTFGHKFHGGRDLGISCADCHHGPQDVEGFEQLEGSHKCRACHYDLKAKFSSEGEGTHPRFIGNACVNCHDEEECETCHKD